MAFMVARTEKRKIGSLSGYQNHVDRKTENHSNKDIDNSKTHLNYDLVGHETDKSFHKEFMDYINENRVGSRAVRKDAVVMQDWIIGSSQEFFDALTPEETRKYFETAVEFFAEKFGRENIRFATVHMDEKTPHMHMGIVPLKDGKLTAKTIFDRNCLRMIQDKLPQAFQKAGFDIQRGEPKSEKVHLQPDEFKATMRAAEEKAREIKKEARKQAEEHVEWRENLEAQNLAEEWADEWLETKQEFPDFRMRTEVYGENDDIPMFVDVDENTPKTFKFDFDDIMNLFKEKFSKLKSYIALEWQKLTRREQEVTKRENTLDEQQKRLETKIEAFESKEQSFINLDNDLSKYKHELIDQMEPLLFSRYNDTEGVNEVVTRLRGDDMTIDNVLSIFNQTFIGYEVDEQRMAKIDKEINDAEKAIQYIKDAFDPNTDFAFRDIERVINLGFANPSEENAWSLQQKLNYLDIHGYHHDGLNKPFPWRLSAIEKYRDEWIAKKEALSADKTKFVSKLHNTVQNIEKVKEQKALELAKKIVPKGPTMGL